MKEIYITTGLNGYPRGLHRGYVGFDDFAEAEKIAEEKDGEVVLLRRRNGWQYYESAGWTDGPIEVTETDYGNDCQFWKTEKEWTDGFKDMLCAILEDDASLDAISEAIRQMSIVRDAFSKLGDDEVVVTRGTKFIDVQKLHLMTLSRDDEQICIGVECNV